MFRGGFSGVLDYACFPGAITPSGAFSIRTAAKSGAWLWIREQLAKFPLDTRLWTSDRPWGPHLL